MCNKALVILRHPSSLSSTIQLKPLARYFFSYFSQATRRLGINHGSQDLCEYQRLRSRLHLWGGLEERGTVSLRKPMHMHSESSLSIFYTTAPFLCIAMDNRFSLYIRTIFLKLMHISQKIYVCNPTGPIYYVLYLMLVLPSCLNPGPGANMLVLLTTF